MNAAKQLNWCWSGVTERLGVMQVTVHVCRSVCWTLPGCDGVPGESSQQWWELMCAVTVGIWGGLDGFGGILFADENFQEAEFGLDPLVLPVLLQHRHPVLLLNISAAEEDGGEKLLISVLKKYLLCLLSDTCSLFLHQLLLRSCQTEPLTTVQQLRFTKRLFSLWNFTTKQQLVQFSVFTEVKQREKTGSHIHNDCISAILLDKFLSRQQQEVKTPESINLSAVYTTAARNFNWTLFRLSYFYQPGSESVSCKYQLTYQTRQHCRESWTELINYQLFFKEKLREEGLWICHADSLDSVCVSTHLPLCW